MRKYDQIAISLLMFTAVLSVWLGIWGPTNTTTWKDWQPLMASVIAIGGAAIVYRGARLAYQASMAKVEFDRSTLIEDRFRKELGIFLRLDYALNILLHKAETLKALIPIGYSDTDLTVQAKWFVIREPDALAESWTSIDSFPSSMARKISEVRGHIYDLENFYDATGDIAWEVKRFGPVPEEMKRIRRTADSLAQLAADTRVGLARMIDSTQI